MCDVKPGIRTDFTQTPHFNYPHYPVQREILSCPLLVTTFIHKQEIYPLIHITAGNCSVTFIWLGVSFGYCPLLSFVYIISIIKDFYLQNRKRISWCWLYDRLVDWLIDWLTDWLIDWLIDRYSPWERPTEPRPSPTWTSTHPARMRYYVWQLSAWIGQLDIEQQVITSLTV